MIFNIFDNTTELMAKFLVSPVEQLCSNILILQEPLPLNKQCLPIPSRSSDLPLDLLVQWQHKENGGRIVLTFDIYKSSHHFRFYGKESCGKL